MQGRALTTQEKAKFLEKLKKSFGDVSKACAAINIARSTAYDHKKNDLAFSEAWDAVIDATVDAMEAEGYRRAVKGTMKPIYQKGVKVGLVREFSDTLLMFFCKARRPDIYRERVDVNSTHSGSIDFTYQQKLDQVYGNDDESEPTGDS